MARTHKVLTVLLLSAAPVAASPTPPDSAVAKELIDLRASLFETGRVKAQINRQKFRALCDKEGYPLVGNVANKGEVYQPSRFCSELRAAKKT